MNEQAPRDTPPSPGTKRRAALAGVVGLVGVVVLAVFLGLPREDLITLITIAGSAALVTGLLGAAALRLLRGRSFTAQVVVVALTSTSAVTAGALAGSSAMFFTTHDLQVLAVVVAVGAVVSIIAALLLGERVGAASRSLGEVARRLGDLDGDRQPTADVAMPENLIAEFKRVGEQLETTRQELEESRARERATDRARRELVSWVSHDLRTPLAGIRAITELLEDGMAEDPEELQGYYATMRRESDKLADLVNDLFEVSKIEAGALTIERTEINLADLVADTLAAAIPVAEKRGITVTGTVEDKNASVEGGLRELTRVLRNLVANAVRESEEGGNVTVEAGIAEARGGPHAYLAVEDTCGGIPPEVMARVFDASYRAESARTPRNDGGAGLGLAIARGFVEAHDGSITVGNVDGGCRFYVAIPLDGPHGAVEASGALTSADRIPPVPLGEPSHARST
ncbi:sensor histidine kinase [Euzebya tangerina]|uniref:sensor histidine kinase n=1 Tax=Euzebya tangerina TaxID=591198 RepID=UPI00196B3430|nr:HAMP domain-containing sensor histidine kinase [Euzebya tangerina]